MLLVQIAISSQWTISSIIEDCCNIGFAYSSERTRHWLLGVAPEWFVRTRWFHGTIPIRAPVNAIHMLFLIASSQGKNSVLLVIVGWEDRRRRGNIGHHEEDPPLQSDKLSPLKNEANRSLVEGRPPISLFLFKVPMWQTIAINLFERDSPQQSLRIMKRLPKGCVPSIVGQKAISMAGWSLKAH